MIYPDKPPVVTSVPSTFPDKSKKTENSELLSKIQVPESMVHKPHTATIIGRGDSTVNKVKSLWNLPSHFWNQLITIFKSPPP